MDEWIHTLKNPISIHLALAALDVWFRAKRDNRSILPPRSVWQVLPPIRGRHHPHTLPADVPPGREITYPEPLRPKLVSYITYDQSVFLQAPQNIVLCCPASLESNSETLRYVSREVGTDNIFRLLRELGAVISLPLFIVNGYSQTIHLLITRSIP